MKTFIGALVVCVWLLLAGNAQAAYAGSHYDGKNKSFDLPYFLCSQDLSNHDGQNQNQDGDKGDQGNGDKGKGDGGGVTLPPPCQPPADNDNAGCGDKGDKDGGCLGGGDKDGNGCGDKGDNGGKGCHGGDGDNPPSVVVPLPASSALGGVGLVIAVLYTWLRSRRSTAA